MWLTVYRAFGLFSPSFISLSFPASCLNSITSSLSVRYPPLRTVLTIYSGRRVPCHDLLLCRVPFSRNETKFSCDRFIAAAADVGTFNCDLLDDDGFFSGFKTGCECTKAAIAFAAFSWYYTSLPI